jgi:hypothetical protein
VDQLGPDEDAAGQEPPKSRAAKGKGRPKPIPKAKSKTSLTTVPKTSVDQSSPATVRSTRSTRSNAVVEPPVKQGTPLQEAPAVKSTKSMKRTRGDQGCIVYEGVGSLSRLLADRVPELSLEKLEEL